MICSTLRLPFFCFHNAHLPFAVNCIAQTLRDSLARLGDEETILNARIAGSFVRPVWLHTLGRLALCATKVGDSTLLNHFSKLGSACTTTMENIPNSSASSTTPGPQSATPPMSSAVRVVLRFVRWLIRSVGFFYFVILLTLSDLLLVLLNLLSRPRPSKGVVPPPFSPSSPPPFGEQPILHLLCRLAASLGAESGKGPDWLQEWTTWSGVGWQGDWGPATMPGPGHSRSPCPAINALANQGGLRHSHLLLSAVAEKRSPNY